MKESLFRGLCFGLTSGIITTLGLMVGLYSFTGSKMVVIGGIMTIAIADSMSDALGIHMSEESQKKSSHKNVLSATLSTFSSKLVFSSTFLIPALFLELGTAILVSVVWGIVALSVLSYFIAKSRKEKPLGVILEHVIIAVAVVFVTRFVGAWISTLFGA